MKRLILPLVLVCAGALPAAEPRNALLMGVWAYTDPALPALPGVDADVNLMAAKLKSLGFNVKIVTNPTLGQAKQAVDDFGATLKAAKGTGLFYFSGHGCENDGKNYLIPRGTSIVSPSDLDDEAMSAQRVLTRMETSGNSVNLVFLDCCRNAYTKGGGELAPMRASGTFIGFATASAEAARASNRGSLYTIALVELLGTPGIGVTGMHTRVTKRVKELTHGRQVPFQYSGLDVDYELVPALSTPAAPEPSSGFIPAAAATPAPPDSWVNIVTLSTASDWAKLASIPAGTHMAVEMKDGTFHSLDLIGWDKASLYGEKSTNDGNSIRVPMKFELIKEARFHVSSGPLAPKMTVATAASNWAELASIPNGKQVFVLLKDGTRFQYVWNDQRKDAIVRQFKLSNGVTAEAVLPFSNIAEIRFEQKP